MDSVVNARNVLVVRKSMAGPLPCDRNQCNGPDGVVLASWPTAAMIRRHTAAPLVLLSEKLIGARDAFVERFLAVALEHQAGGAPDVDRWYHGKGLSPMGSVL